MPSTNYAAIASKQPNCKELCIKTSYALYNSQVYLEHCHPTLNHHIALMMALIAE